MCFRVSIFIMFYVFSEVRCDFVAYINVIIFYNMVKLYF